MSTLSRFPIRILSEIWSSANRTARYARDRGWISSRKFSTPTIGIGNVQAGGAGKTPLTIRLAQDALAKGLQVAVLTRGYRGAWESTGGILSPEEPPASPELCGDEAALIRDQAPGVWIGVGADRIRQFETLESNVLLRTGRKFDLVLLDDAYQHWKIRCDQYVVAVTDSVFGDQLFRDEYSVISPDDVVVLTKGGTFPAALAEYPKQVRTRYRYTVRDRRVQYRFVTAIADPERARAALEEAGFTIVDMTAFPDHHFFSRAEVGKILEEALQNDLRVLVTGKDWVKWRALGISPNEVEVVEPVVEIFEGQVIWNALLPE